MQEPNPGTESHTELSDDLLPRFTASPGLIALKDLLATTSEALQARYESRDTLAGYSTGFIDLDFALQGLQPASFIVLAGRPAMGTTALALNLAVNVARLSGKQVVFFSLEDFGNRVAERMISIEARIHGFRLRSGFVTEEDRSRLPAAIEALARLPVCIDEDPAITVAEMRDKLLAHRDLGGPGLGLVVIDSLHMMRSPEQGDNERMQVLSCQLKRLACELQVPILALTRVRRTVEERHGYRPKLRDLPGSGALERAADAVCFLYREEYYFCDPDEPGIAELIIARNRWGSNGTIKLKFEREFGRFESLLTPPQPPQDRQQNASWSDPDFDDPME